MLSPKLFSALPSAPRIFLTTAALIALSSFAGTTAASAGWVTHTLADPTEKAISIASTYWGQTACGGKDPTIYSQPPAATTLNAGPDQTAQIGKASCRERV